VLRGKGYGSHFCFAEDCYGTEAGCSGSEGARWEAFLLVRICCGAVLDSRKTCPA